MRNVEYFKGKKVTVLGLASSGLACANLLHKLGARVSVSELEDNPTTRSGVCQLISPEITLELGKHTREFISGRDFVVASPGLDNARAPVVWAKEAGIPVISDIEVGGVLCSGTVIAVTGSGGKTTVTTLMARVLEAAGQKVFTLGNIGNPFCGEVELIREKDFVCLEVSSFQLERVREFKPQVAVMLNISRNHLDWHKDMQEYIDAKKRIFLRQDKGDYLVVNKNDETLCAMAQDASSKVLFFAQSQRYNPNQAAVVEVVGIFAVSESLCQKVFGEFKGLPHRLEFVARIGGVKFINDSKATLAESCAWAINNIEEPIILIAGGKDKGVDYRRILPAAKGRVKEVVLIGEAREKIRHALAGELVLSQADDLTQAVALAYGRSAPGDCVLLSPMCSSFDMFTNYQQRGEAFRQAVLNLQ